MNVPASKLGAKVARQIENEILVQELPVGRLLGTEEELSAEYGVSRWIMREAIAIAEMDGLVESRRGQSGGLYVSSPAFALRLQTLRHYFILAGATAQQINETRRAVEGRAFRVAMQKLDEAGTERLRKLTSLPKISTAEEPAIHTNALLQEVMLIADNQALNLFCFALAQSNIDLALWHGASTQVIGRLSEQTLDTRLRQIEALIAYDMDGVLACQRDIAEAGIRLHESWTIPPHDVPGAVEQSSLLTRTYSVDDAERIAKKPEAVARLISQRIIDLNLDVGDAIGSEGEILEAFGISRNVLREAIRLLERYGIIRVQRGKTGGMRVMRPDPSTIARATSLFLADAQSAEPAIFQLISDDVKLLAATSAAREARRNGASLPAELERYRSEINSATDKASSKVLPIHGEFLARASSNPVVECLMYCLAPKPVTGDIAATHQTARGKQLKLQLKLADAIDAGDTALSRRISVLLK